ncbi:3-chlorobenzoate-3,4-dioxygenase [Komagataeibacter rhaeticus]|uniref:Rieske 2Fe-2S domain-containing protein n=1 Tax=Komagataeibacter rhaeticus TaxID=215221 RepID=UPI00055726D8|nr:Rieske 2Fe-2S domain-containing protein [Komagataeibacter rhaeticus]MBL7239810.1 Rieske 2Fe-2S domain-containing protein [Komagataeibacter rhaeticus]PYD53292.1 3-chlorobenzoate-3,4-dioxygenase [Komagataeibacter rhaeticus]GBQ12274.1 vanillate O-demethylase oxygenase [Komagataeibacter rhaeticus DSM 16663]
MERWHPVSVLSDLHRGEVAGVRIDGHEVVLWREDTDSATLHAWEDRCPHRGMRLSFGFVREGALGCLYHGWQFGGTARCRLIPAHPNVRVPAAIQVRTHMVREHAGLAWVGMEGAGAFPATMPVPWPVVQPVRSVHVSAGAGLLRHALGMHADVAMTWRGPVGLAVHAPVAGQAMLHVVRARDAQAPSPLVLSRWAERLRDGVEGGGDTTRIMGELA